MSILDKGMDILNKEREEREAADRRQQQAHESREQASTRRILKLKEELSDPLLTIEHDEKNHMLTISRKRDGAILCLVRTGWEWYCTSDWGYYDDPSQKDEVQYHKEYLSTSNITYSKGGNCHWTHYSEKELARYLVTNI